MTERALDRDAEISKAESCLSRVYDEIVSWLQRERLAEVLKTFDSSNVSTWEVYSDYPPGQVTLGMHIDRAIILGDQRNTYGIISGRRSRSRYEREERPSLQFGFLRSKGAVIQKADDMAKLKLLAGPSRFDRSCAEFDYDIDSHKIRVDCWIDDGPFGGDGIGRWEESALGPKGEEAMVRLAKRLVRNYDPI